MKLLRFKPVEIRSRVCFIGKSKKILHYQVRSVSLVPQIEAPFKVKPSEQVPEIFWQ
ncbi:MAG: hypothetical protein M0P58_07450 [Bacteroidales bacterium]|jgi:hypothetical protein|nr:hypothetical protein [Bacteroidales bacterium]